MLPQNQPPCSLSSCPQQVLFNQGMQPINYSYPMFQPFQPVNQPLNYSYQPPQYNQPSMIDTELNDLKKEVLQLKYQLSCLKEIADEQLDHIKILVNKVDSIPQPKCTVNKRKAELETVETVNKRYKQPVNYSQIHSGNSPTLTSSDSSVEKPVVKITDEVININTGLDLSDLLEKTNEDMFEDGDYYIDKTKTNVVKAKTSDNWIIHIDIITTDKETGRKVFTPKKMALASDLFDHLLTTSSNLSALINKKLKKNVHFLLTNVPYFNSRRLLLTKKGIEELINQFSLKGQSFDPKDMAVWKGMIEELQ